MTSSPRQVCSEALMEIGALSQGEIPSASDANEAFLRFQVQLDAWQADHLTLYTFPRTQFTWPASTSTRTIGPTGNIVTSSVPVYIEGINYVVPSSSPAVEVPMGQMDADSYMNLSIKNLASNLPTQWFYNKGDINGTLTFWPVPNQTVIAVYSWQGVNVPVTLDDGLTGPPGYLEAFIYQLALRLCRPFARLQTPDLVQDAHQALLRIQGPNRQPGLLGMDTALVPTQGGGYNIYSDTSSNASNR